ncbi:hypothetical protein JIR001_18890 [Polycladomyces abyssicola]|uniref:Uncharacterized protein n=1 Tax=Polycladomyces abyssicola TaxID=1125966 RepID=A0A8D5UES1_9BACL|nr:hypothetical protein JIR001_18890 [Polycladomyces abyssicola]
MEFIRPVLSVGFPLLGIVSEGQCSIRKAIENLVDVPYQSYRETPLMYRLIFPVFINMPEELKVEIDQRY